MKRHSLREAAQQCEVSPETLVRFISFRWVVPVEWHLEVLDDEDLARARLICELQQTYGVNDEAIPIILNLIDQLNLLIRVQ